MYETTSGWWDDGWFHLPVMERRDDGQYSTGYMFDATPCSNVAADHRDAVLRYANRFGLEAAAASSGGWLFKGGERPQRFGCVTGVPVV